MNAPLFGRSRIRSIHALMRSTEIAHEMLVHKPAEPMNIQGEELTSVVVDELRQAPTESRQVRRARKRAHDKALRNASR